MPPSLIEAYAGLGIEVHQVYGLTETCGPACVISPDDAMSHVGSTGKAFFHTDVRIVDFDGKDVGVGVPGEVLVRGRHIMAGYWNREAATAETIIDGWLHTGDVAVRDDDGFVYIQDRIKDMIISGGENVYPAEIEDVLLSHPGIAEVAVLGMPSEKWGESPLAVVVRADPDLRGSGLGTLQRQAGAVQAAEAGGVHRRHPPHPDRQSTETRAARAIPARGPRVVRRKRAKAAS